MQTAEHYNRHDHYERHDHYNRGDHHDEQYYHSSSDREYMVDYSVMCHNNTSSTANYIIDPGEKDHRDQCSASR